MNDPPPCRCNDYARCRECFHRLEDIAERRESVARERSETNRSGMKRERTRARDNEYDHYN